MDMIYIRKAGGGVYRSHQNPKTTKSQKPPKARSQQKPKATKNEKAAKTKSQQKPNQKPPKAMKSPHNPKTKNTPLKKKKTEKQFNLKTNSKMVVRWKPIYGTRLFTQSNGVDTGPMPQRMYIVIEHQCILEVEAPSVVFLWLIATKII